MATAPKTGQHSGQNTPNKSQASHGTSTQAANPANAGPNHPENRDARDPEMRIGATKENYGGKADYTEVQDQPGKGFRGIKRLEAEGSSSIPPYQTETGGVVYTLVEPATGHVYGAVEGEELADWLEVDGEGRAKNEPKAFRVDQVSMGNGILPVIYVSARYGTAIADPTLPTPALTGISREALRANASSRMAEAYHGTKGEGSTTKVVTSKDAKEKREAAQK